jgi:ABC-type molybdate transport system substrate-binding protein
VAAILDSGKQIEAGKSLIDFLRAPEAATVFNAKGMEPATQ